MISCSDTFAENPVIYHIFTDRFGPGRDDARCEDTVGGFYGGRLADITQKIDQGWFSELGVNAILISAPYEQIRGWVPGGGNRFKHYGYHGYYALDYTVLDERFGTEDDLHALVSAAHGRGIRVIFDIVMNHPGYADAHTMHAMGITVVRPGWEQSTPANAHDFIDVESPRWSDWWGPDWVRAKFPGYQPGGSDDLTMQLMGLPDFRTESKVAVRLPAFLRNKVNSKAVELADTTVRGYLITWLTDWIRQFGIDGFRCDSARHVELDAWFALKQAASRSKSDWDSAQQVLGTPFWMLGEVFGQPVEPSHYFDFGFDCLLNFAFQSQLQQGVALDTIYEDYALQLQGLPNANFLSYISSHDTFLFDRAGLIAAGTALMLAPGGVLILYGDETARPAGLPEPGDPTQATRSAMNWSSVNHDVLAHWRKLGQFRARHLSLARGRHTKHCDMPYVFSRMHASGDRVLVVIGPQGELRINVAMVFSEGEWVRDAYSGDTCRVVAGHIVVQAQKCVLLEAMTSPSE